MAESAELTGYADAAAVVAALDKALSAVQGSGVATLTSSDTEPATKAVGDLWLDEAASPTTQYVRTTDVVNVLNSTSTVAPLSAAQGKVLNDTIGDIDAALDALNGESV
jgi:hypothetical protein